MHLFLPHGNDKIRQVFIRRNGFAHSLANHINWRNCRPVNLLIGCQTQKLPDNLLQDFLMAFLNELSFFVHSQEKWVNNLITVH
jgi:hypothetical protein